ncbi:hypothetical protein FIU94_16535 [Sulfitobacter sp. THAF37]|uniref:hypothetical protein n=1 Tax=Sulfitobacter sp. THAF37 TaxID=2587855 RepID=UPI001267A837|nr:hypothetical protein [Sulfitobacter sp. THAF37]QFT60439.1 hypothetical protein FIU94_16535 [Sulfitobacter sp. THAF37]
MLIRALLFCVTVSGAAHAQEQLTPDAFLDRAEGRTLTFKSAGTGRVVGIEEFLSRHQTKWAREDGSCTYGQVTVDGETICFQYEDNWGELHCWVPYDNAGTLMVRSPDGAIQHVTRITDLPVLCQDKPMS